MSGACPRNRGLTLIEILLALALMSSLMVLSGEWIRTALQKEAATTSLRDRAALDRALDRIEDVLRAGDWPVEGRAAIERVSAVQAELRIRSRMPHYGAADARAIFDQSASELTIRLGGDSRVLAAGLEDVQFEVREVAGDDRIIVSIELTALGGEVAQREILVR